MYNMTAGFLFNFAPMKETYMRWIIAIRYMKINYCSNNSIMVSWAEFSVIWMCFSSFQKLQGKVFCFMTKANRKALACPNYRFYIFRAAAP